MNDRNVVRVLSGLFLGMFIAVVSLTVVTTALPQIIIDLKGDQAAFTWVVSSALLAQTATTPLWGKLADTFSRKLLIQIALSIFVLGSALAGLAINTEGLIAFRVLQGLGTGGLTALSQVILADVTGPRERGKYMGMLGAIMAFGIVSGPLIGGVITDTVGWRWNFFIAVPFEIVAIVLLQKSLRQNGPRRLGVKIDYLGAALLTISVSTFMLWVSLAGHSFEWLSSSSALMVGGSLVVLIIFIVVEMRVVNPILPLTLFRNRTFSLAVFASASGGVAMFGSTVFLSQYMQLSWGTSPTDAGVLTLPISIGVLVGSYVSGASITRTGKWKSFMIVSAVMMFAGVVMLTTIGRDTPYFLLTVYMVVVGLGMGAISQNIVLVVQNSAPQNALGVATSSMSFFRALGGTVGVSVMGSVLAVNITAGLTSRKTEIVDELAASIGLKAQPLAESLIRGQLPDLDTLPESVAAILGSVYGSGVGNSFFVVVPLALLTVVTISLMPNRALGSESHKD